MQEPTVSSEQQVVIISNPQPETVNNGTGPNFVMKVLIVGFVVVASALGLAEVIIYIIKHEFINAINMLCYNRL